MNRIRVAAAAAVIAGSMVAGGVIGATIFGAGIVANAASPSPAASPGTFHSNEDATHEAGESASQETAENNGTRPAGGPHSGAPNEDPTHEAGESAAREQQENSGQKPAAPASPSTGT